MSLPPLEFLFRIIRQIDTPKNRYIVRNMMARLNDEMVNHECMYTSFALDSFYSICGYIMRELRDMEERQKGMFE
jgi:hypothetical protein